MVHIISTNVFLAGVLQTTIEVGGTVTRPSQYMFLVHFYSCQAKSASQYLSLCSQNGQMVEGNRNIKYLNRNGSEGNHNLLSLNI